MKKISIIFIVILITIISLGIFVSCNKDEGTKLSGVQPTSECCVKDFQQLNAVFPHKLLLPENCGNEEIIVRFSDTNNSEYWENLIRKNEKIDLLIGGDWSKRYTDYTISVSFYYNENWIHDSNPPFEFNEDEINGYKILQLKSNQEIFLFDSINKIDYSIGLSTIVEYDSAQRDNMIRGYINEMLRV